VRIVLSGLITLIFLLAAVIVFAGQGVADWFPSSGAGDGTKVRLETVEEKPLAETISAPGEIIPNVKVDISAEVSARVIELPFREGDRVRRGDIVVRLDDKEFKAALDSATARRDGEKHRLDSEVARLAGPIASVANAKAVLARQQALFDSGDVSRQVLDDAIERVRDLEATIEASRFNINVIESSLAAAEAEIKRTQEAVDKTIIRSPMDGMITVLNAEVGELVVVGTMNNAGTVILTIGDLSKVKMNARVNEADIARVARDQRAEVRINAYRDEVFEGRVVKVPLQRTDELGGANAGGGYFKVEVEIAPREGLQILSGLACNVDIEIETHKGLSIPSQAVLDRPTEELPPEVVKDNPLVDRQRRTTSIVFRKVDGKALMTPVRTGPSNLSSTLVTAGLEAGDVVVVGPFKALEKLKHNDPIEDENKPKPGEATSNEAAIASTNGNSAAPAK
jgi:HlyD family secretion protein